MKHSNFGKSFKIAVIFDEKVVLLAIRCKTEYNLTEVILRLGIRKKERFLGLYLQQIKWVLFNCNTSYKESSQYSLKYYLQCTARTA